MWFQITILVICLIYNILVKNVQQKTVFFPSTRGAPLKLIKSYLSYRWQRFSFSLIIQRKDATFSRENIWNILAQHVSILKPLLLLLYSNELKQNIWSNTQIIPAILYPILHSYIMEKITETANILLVQWLSK